MYFGLFVLRVVVGLLFAAHGAQKLFGWFGGHGRAGTAGFFESIGLRPGHVHAGAAGWSEFGGGLALALGLFTPVAAAALIAVMTAAVMTVHRSRGLWATGGGYEYNLVLVTVAFALAAVGPGHWSLDHLFTFNDHGALWGVGALVVGGIGGAGAVLTGRGEASERSSETEASAA
jgi:putative oxidoreductase